MTHNLIPEMPCGPILELHGQRKRFHVPYGLKPLIEELAREALKAQPANLNEFFANFLEERVKRKQEEAEMEKKKARKSWQVHRWSWEGTSILNQEDYEEFIRSLPPDKDLNHYATVIQAGYRGYRGRSISKEARKSRDEERRRASEEMEKLNEAYLMALQAYEEEEGEGDDELESLTEFEEDGEGEDDGVVLYEYDEADFSDKEDSKAKVADIKKIPLSDEEEYEQDEEEMLEHMVEGPGDVQTLPPLSEVPRLEQAPAPPEADEHEHHNEKAD